MLRLERRINPSQKMVILTPFIAVALTMSAGVLLFAVLGKNPFQAIRIIFFDPLFNETVASYTRPQILVKAAPLIMIAIGLSFGFRANIWNIGAEGQFIIGAVLGGAVGLAFYPAESILILPLMIIVGALGGFFWAMIPALLKIKFNANEILVSLMLVYVATNVLNAAVTGPLKSPVGLNFPVSRNFNEYTSAYNAELIANTGLHTGVLAALALVIVAYILLHHHVFGFQVRVLGQSHKTAVFGGIKPPVMVALCLGLSGALAGLAGIFEVTGPAGKLSVNFPLGYGFTAIIVAFLGRLHPIGIFFAGLLMALTYVGGELAQFQLSIPAAAIQVFQGMLLFFMLGTDILIYFRIRKHKKKDA